jgi:hypothetical protein
VMLVSNQRPLPSEGTLIECGSVLELARLLQIEGCFREQFALVFRRFTQVAAQISRLLHQHKVQDDRHSSSCLEATYASFVLGVFSECQ